MEQHAPNTVAPSRARRSGRFANAYGPFFVAAFLFAAVSIPLWTATWMGMLVPCATCWAPAQHGHEMLLGFALAMMAGFLFTRVSRKVVAVGLSLWLAGRLAMLFDAPAALLALLLPAMPLVVFWWGGRPFLKAAKTPHNMVPGVAVGLLLLAEAVYVAGRVGGWTAGERGGVLLAFALVSAMLFVMGGRLIAAASAGALRRKGETLPQAHLVQRPWEWAGVAGVAAMAVADATGAIEPVAALGATLAGTATLVRVASWRPHWMLDMPDLWPLHLGYAFLGLGLLAKGVGQGTELLPMPVGLHLVTVAALGCLAATIAMRTTRQRAGLKDPPGWEAALPALAFVLAGLLRAGVPWEPVLLVWSSAVWSAACLWVAAQIAVLLRLSGEA